MTTTPIIYNLFPRLAGPFDRWAPHAERAARLGFNWVYLNPLHYPGFSGSLYAVKDYYRVNPSFLPVGTEGDGLAELRSTLAMLKERGLRPMMDLVINHTAKDSPLIEAHPSWYVWEGGEVASPYAVDPDDPSKRTVWGDLAEIDNARASDRDGLWRYWAELVRHSLDLGFEGFRCDAAYKVPAELWRFLIDTARQYRPGTQFFAETLGCTVDQALALSDAGFDFVFNSSKWWDYRQPWALEQHEQFGRIAPSIAFPESHDTPRLAAESNGSEAIQRQRYAFAAVFSAGLMMPIGYEFGFRRPLHVVESRPEDWEAPAFDITGFVERVNRLKLGEPLFQGEGRLRSLLPLDADVLLLERRVTGASDAVGWILVNKRADTSVHAELPTSSADEPRAIRYLCRDDSAEPSEAPAAIELRPAEVVLVLTSYPS